MDLEPRAFGDDLGAAWRGGGGGWWWVVVGELHVAVSRGGGGGGGARGGVVVVMVESVEWVDVVVWRSWRARRRKG